MREMTASPALLPSCHQTIDEIGAFRAADAKQMAELIKTAPSKIA